MEASKTEGEDMLKHAHHTKSLAVRGAALFAAGLDGGGGGEVGGEIVGGEGLDVKGKKAERGDAKIHGAVGTVHGHGQADDVSLVGADNIDCLLGAAAFGDHVFDDQYFFAGRDFEAAPQNEFAFLFFNEDEAALELTGNFLAKHETAHRRGNNGDRAERTDLGGEGRAEFFDVGHLLQRKGALEELAAVQAAAQEEMSFEQRAGVAEDLQHFVFGHGANGRIKAGKLKFKKLI